MRRGIIAIIVVLLLLTIPTAVRYLQYYQLGTPERTPPPEYNPAEVVDSVAVPASNSFVDEPEVGEGVILLDAAHDNLFELDDIASLTSRLSARGMTLQSFSAGDLARTLRAVNAFVVVAPTEEFSQAEVQAVTQFVERGGRLLLVGDPTRFNVIFDDTDPFLIDVIIQSDEIPLNSLANHFDLTFIGDYLYNTEENEGNFRNILLKSDGFGESALTEGLETVVFYGAHSLQVGPTAEVLLAGDDGTWSSATDRPGGLTLGATSADEHVLALSDLHFMTDPYHTVYDNGRFVAQIADFLSQPSREYVLADFPYLYSDDVDLVYTDAPDLGAGAFSTIIPLQDGFRTIGKDLVLAGTAVSGHETLQLGLYNQSSSIADILDANGISLIIDPPIEPEDEEAEMEEEVDEEEAEESTEEETETDADADESEEEDIQEPEPEEEDSTEEMRLIQSDLGNIEMSGMALIVLDESSSEANMVVLAASAEGLNNTVARLLDLIPLDAEYALAECLVQGNIAFCPTGIEDEEVEAELITSTLTESTTPDEEEDEEEGEEPDDGIDAEIQGNIALGETVEGELAEAEKHGWIFAEGPALIDITLEPGEEMDAVLEIYNPDNELITSSDEPFKGSTEELTGVEIPDDGEYTIVIREFFDEPGPYTLTVIGEATEPSDPGEGDEGDEEDDEGEDEETPDINIFYFMDDDGEAIEDGFTSVDALAPFLADYEVQLWSATEDGALTEDMLEDVDFLIWDSGDYRNPDGFFDEDTGVIFAYLESGNPLFVNGASPTIFGDIELAAVADLEVGPEDEILTNGYETGDIIILDDTYEVAITELFVSDIDEDSDFPYLLRGPDSEESGGIISVATIDEFNNDQKSIIFMLPFALLPEADQVLFFDNMMAWFDF